MIVYIEIGLLKTIDDTDFVSAIDEDDCAYGRDADLATAGKDVSNEGNNATVDIDVILSNPQDSNFRDDVEEGLGNETEKEQTEIENTFTSTTKIEEKYDKATIRLLQLPFHGSKAPTDVDGADSHVAIDTDDLRMIFPECSVCLNEFIVGERISWSSGDNCDHVFHEDCILRWFLTLRRRADAKRRKRKCDVECKLHCPMCRQDFIASPNSTFS